MDIAKLGVAIDPAKAVDGTSKVKAALKQIGDTAKTELGKVDAANKKAGDSAVKMGQTHRRGMSDFSRGVLDMMNSIGVMNNGFGRMTMRAQSMISSFRAFGGMGSALLAIVPIIGAAAVAVGGLAIAFGTLKSSMDVAGPVQRARQSFETITGSAAEASRVIKKLRDDSNLTGADLGGSMDTVKRFLALGFSTGDAMQLNRSILDVAGAVGLTSEEARLLGMALAQVQAKGIVSMEELRQQIAEKGVPVFEELQKKVGKFGMEFNKAVEQGQVPAKDLIDIFLKMEGGFAKFAGGAEKMTKTYPGAIARVKAIYNDLKIELGEPLDIAMAPAINDLGDELLKLKPQVADIGLKIGRFTFEFLRDIPLLKQELAAWGYGWQVLGRFIARTTEQVGYVMDRFADDAGPNSEEWNSYWKDAFQNFPINIKAGLEMAQAYTEYFIEKSRVQANEFMGMWSKAGESAFDYLVNFAGNDESKAALAKLNEQAAANNGTALPTPEGMIGSDGKWHGDTNMVLPPKPTDPIADRLESELQRIQNERDAAIRESDKLKMDAQTRWDMSEGGKYFNGPVYDPFASLMESPVKPTSELPKPTPKPTPDPTGLGTGNGADKVLDITKGAPKANALHSDFDTLMKDWGNLGKQVDVVATGIANSIADNITNGISGLIDGTKSAKQAFSEMAAGIVKDIIAMTVRLTVYAAISKAFGPAGEAFNIWVASMGRSMAHTGGEVGKTNLSNTRVPVYHTGGKLSSESMVKVDKGETILTRRRSAELARELESRRQPRERQAAASATIINVLDRNEIADVVAKNPSAVVNALSRNLPQVRRMIMSGQRA